MHRRLAIINQEIWLISSIFALALGVNYLVASQQVILGLYVFPTLYSAFYFGRRDAILTALASALLVTAVTLRQNGWSAELSKSDPVNWIQLLVWSSTLLVTAYVAGILQDRQRESIAELRQTYQGLLVILRQFISNDKQTENHCYRVSVYAARIAAELGLPPETIEDIRAAALLHDIGKLEISRDVLYKASSLSQEEFAEMKSHVEKGAVLLQPAGKSLQRVINIILAHHERIDGSGYNGWKHESIPLEARIIAVADSFDAITSDRPYRRGSPPQEGRQIIENLSGKDFDPLVVNAFLRLFQRRELEVPEIVL